VTIRQCLDTATYHRFAVSYTDFIAVLLQLLEKGNKWHCVQGTESICTDQG